MRSFGRFTGVIGQGADEAAHGWDGRRGVDRDPERHMRTRIRLGCLGEADRQAALGLCRRNADRLVRIERKHGVREDGEAHDFLRREVRRRVGGGRCKSHLCTVLLKGVQSRFKLVTRRAVPLLVLLLMRRQVVDHLR